MVNSMIVKCFVSLLVFVLLHASHAHAINPVSSIASTHDGNVPANTLDNNLSTRWSANGDGQWIQYDLGSTYTVTSVDIAFYKGDQRVSTFTVQVSANASSWSTVFVGDQPLLILAQQNIDVTDTSGRYVRITGHGNSSNTWNSFTEVDINTAIPNTPTPTPISNNINLALGKATNQSTTGWSGLSSLAVDGNTSGQWRDASITHTDNEYQSWWEVDLGAVKNIDHVNLWNRTDCCSERLSNFYVLVSDTPFNSTNLNTTTNQSGIGSYYYGPTASSPTQVNVNRTGRYLRVQLAGTNPLSIAEFEVIEGVNPGNGSSTTKSVSFQSSSAEILNPERGFFRFVDVLTGTDFSSVTNGGDTLAFSLVRLDNYRNTSLPSSFIGDFERGLNAIRAAGLKVVLRFSYNAGPWPVSEPDASLSRVLSHIDQLAPIFQTHADVILVVQAGFIGAWGEWHSSTNNLINSNGTTNSATASIVDGLLDALPTNRSIQIRVPMFKDDLFGSLPANQAFSGNDISRVGHHNDCFLASDTDFGTYPEGAQEQWKNYIASDTRFTPMGGETCAVYAARTNCSPAMAEMKRLHFSYLNRDYNTDVINGWSTQGCLSEIRKEMGYRFSLLKAQISTNVSVGGSFNYSITLNNSGWASLFNPRPVKLIIRGNGGSHTVTLNNVDPRTWSAGADHTVSGSLNLPASLPSGQYNLYLTLPDESNRISSDSRFAIQFANQETWNNGENLITSFTIK